MTHRTKQIVSLLLTAALVAVLLLSVSLSDLQLQAGGAFPGSSNTDQGVQEAASPPQTESSYSLPLIEAAFAVLLVVLMIYVPARVIGAVKSRNIAGLLLGLILLLALVSLLPRVIPGPPQLVAEEAPASTTPRSSVYPVSPLGKPPREFTWLTAAGLLLGVSLIAIYLLKRAERPHKPADTLIRETEKAIHDLRTGKDFPNVIIRYYLQMTEVLQAEQKIERHQSMTAREFESWLESKGIPAGPVQQLTSLFEKARYGKDQVNHVDEQTGMDCLEQIIRYCRKEGTEGQWTSS